MNLGISEATVAIVFGIIGILTSSLSWAVHMKVRNDILENNVQSLKEIEALKEKVIHDLNAVNIGLVSLKTTVADTLMAMVETKFVREDTFRTRLEQIEDKIENVKTVVEVQMKSMHETFDSRLEDIRRHLIECT